MGFDDDKAGLVAGGSSERVLKERGFGLAAENQVSAFCNARGQVQGHRPRVVLDDPGELGLVSDRLQHRFSRRRRADCDADPIRRCNQIFLHRREGKRLRHTRMIEADAATLRFVGKDGDRCARAIDYRDCPRLEYAAGRVGGDSLRPRRRRRSSSPGLHLARRSRPAPRQHRRGCRRDAARHAAADPGWSSCDPACGTPSSIATWSRLA